MAELPAGPHHPLVSKCHHYRLKKTILIVDDEKNTREGLRDSLEDAYEVYVAADAGGARAVMETDQVDLLLTDLRLGADQGMELLDWALRQERPPVGIVMTAYGTIDTAVEAMKHGAYDFVTKPVNIDRLELLIKRALHGSEIERENIRLREQIDKRYGLENFIGDSPAMHQVLETIRQVAASRATVLITGESGTGKEVVARTLHNMSPRASNRFVAISCAAIPETLLESEILGHEKGAFTSANATRPGVFELAHQGTLFLDEIAEMPASLQSKLLRVLEDNRVRRIGGSREIPVNVRVLSATNVSIKEYLSSGALREDLYFRLNVFTLQMPSLRERMEDIPLLAQAFLGEFAHENKRSVAGFSMDAMKVMQNYNWPGNVRELRNAVQRAVILCKGDEIKPEHLPPAVLDNPNPLAVSMAPAPGVAGNRDLRVPIGTPLEAVERQVILETLSHCNDNKTRTAAMLGISAKTLHSKLNRYGVREALRNRRTGRWREDGR